MKGIISKTTAGIIIGGGLATILLVIIFSQSFSLGLASVIILFLIIFFLYSPSIGLLLILIVRTATDRIGGNYSIEIGNGIALNSNALLGLLVVALTLACLTFQKNKTKKIFSIVTATWMIYLLIASFSIIFSIDKIVSFYELFRLLSIFAIFLLGYSIASPKKPTLNLKIVLWSSLIPLAVAFYQALTATGMSRIAGLSNRLYGTFSDPNSFASFALIIIALLIYFTIKKNDKLNFAENWKEYSAIILLVIILMATFSRGGWLALLIFSIFLSIFKKPTILIFLAGGLILLALTVEPIKNRLEDVYNPPITSSVYWRFQQWDKVYRLFKQKPLTGHGLGTEIIVHENAFGFNAGNPYTHNDILKNALETGIFGAVAYSLLLLTTLIALLKNYYQTKNTTLKNIFLIIFILFLAEIGFSMTSNILRSTIIQWIIWLLVGSSLALSNSFTLKTKTIN